MHSHDTLHSNRHLLAKLNRRIVKKVVLSNVYHSNSRITSEELRSSRGEGDLALE